MPKRKRLLIKKGTPHPKYPSYKFDSAHLTERKADDREDKLLESPQVDSTRMVRVPKQYLVFSKRATRITPKTPRLR